jgi:hypothetical protein
MKVDKRLVMSFFWSCFSHCIKYKKKIAERKLHMGVKTEQRTRCDLTGALSHQKMISQKDTTNREEDKHTRYLIHFRHSH